MQCNEKRKFILPHSSVQLSANAESRVRVWAEELSSSSTLEAKRGEEGEQVAYLALGLQGQHVASEPYGVVPAQRLNDGWR